MLKRQSGLSAFKWTRAALVSGKAKSANLAGWVKNSDLKIMVASVAAKRELQNFTVSKPPLKFVLNLLECFEVALAPRVGARFLRGNGVTMANRQSHNQDCPKIFHGSFLHRRSESARILPELQMNGPSKPTPISKNS
ncbi:MAG: hypothetical protein WA579_02605 [Rhodomicrobium sp.]